MKKKQKGRHHASKSKSHFGLIFTTLLLLLLVCAYGAGGIYFSTHFLPGTTLNNSDVSGMTLDEAKALLMSSSNSYVLSLEEQDYNKESISGEDIDLTAEISDDFDKILAQQGGVTWILSLLGNKEYTLDEGIITYSYDENKLSKLIDELECVDPQYPVEATDAELVLMDGEFKIVPESESNVAHRDELEDKVKYAIESQQTSINLREEGLYDQPKVFSDDEDLIAKKAACDEIVDMSIKFIFGYTEENVDIQTISTWVNTEKLENGDYSLTANTDKIKEYVKLLADKYNTVGKPKQFATNSGEVIEITTGDYGWQLDNDYAIDKLKEIVLAKESVTLNLTDRSEESDKWWMRVAVGYDANGNDYYGNTYAEVSIDKQHMWMYQDGEVVLETDVVTGNPNLGNDTPKGAFRIRYQEKNATLRGPGYVTPVAYWMVFADDVGFHDATWQPAFGGQLYLTNGSHGCVNMPLDQAGKLYDLIYRGMPVFVY